MTRTFKTFLLWIIMIALPMQATAAVIKASCSSEHHAMQAQNVAPDHAVSLHAHSDHASASADLAGEVFSTLGADKSVEHDGHSTCSACAACCVGAVAPPSAQIRTPDFSAFIKAIIVSNRVLTGFIPAGLERPPRSFLA